MRDQELVSAIRWLKVETGSLVCMGCGHEHNCGVSGCAVMREAADRIANQSTHIAALQQEIEKLRAQLRHLEELAEADRDGRLVVLPFTSGRTLLCKENIDSPQLMKDVELAIRYCSSCGIVFHMGYNVFCGLVKHGRITAVSEEAEKALEAKKDE